MPSTFFGIEIGTRALTASQLALDVVGQNEANVSTPGYSRQVINLETTDPYTIPDYSQTKPGQLGTGLTVAAVTRVRDEFIDKRVWDANATQGGLDNLKDIIGRVEQAYNEPGATGVGQLMTNFFNSFADLSANPESGAIRSTVRNSADTLVAAFHSLDTALKQINPEINAKIASNVGDVNNIARQIADLNRQVRMSVANGDQPNDLLDKRGQLLDKLSGLVAIQVTNTVSPNTGKPTGEVQVNVGGYTLVQSDTANALPTTSVTTNNSVALLTSDGTSIPLTGGSLYGLARAVTLVNGYQSDLDTLASNLATAVNTIHSGGYGLDGVTGRDFFSVPATGVVGAGSIAVNPAIESDLNAIAAAAAPTPPNAFAPGNGDNARQLAQLTSAPVINGFTLDEYYNAKVALVGADSHSFQTQSDNQARVVNLLQNQQASVSGVSLDEELTKMLQYQRSYQAAARVVNTMDSIIDRIINGLGAGRG